MPLEGLAALGAPDPSLPQEGAFMGWAPGGYYRCSGYQGISVNLLLGPINGPSYGEDPHEEAPREENDDRNC
jgi:hypothetical protein